MTQAAKGAPGVGPAEEDRLRADLYDFLGALLARPPDAALLRKSAALSGDDSALGRAVHALSRVAAATTPEAVESEFTALFIGIGRGGGSSASMRTCR